MLKILQTLNNGWIVSDPAYRGDFNEEDHEETVPMDFPGMRVPEVSPMELWGFTHLRGFESHIALSPNSMAISFTHLRGFESSSR